MSLPCLALPGAQFIDPVLDELVLPSGILLIADLPSWRRGAIGPLLHSVHLGHQVGAIRHNPGPPSTAGSGTGCFDWLPMSTIDTAAVQAVRACF